MKNFVLLGTAGYVAPRHLKAIKDTGNNLIASFDISDSVGIIDRYFPSSFFSTSLIELKEYLNAFLEKGESIDFFSICTPNHLHEEHIKMALQFGADVICEKPIVINPTSLKNIRDLQKGSDKKVYTILQLRLLDQLVKLKSRIQEDNIDHYNVDLKYITPRGKWYLNSWKGNESKSGGIITNIGIHLFDLLIWLFGSVENFELEQYSNFKAAGKLKLQKANVNWFLSIDHNDLDGLENKAPSFRSIKINDVELEFSQGFENLHTMSYQKIINNKGFDINEAAQSIELVYEIRNSNITNH